MRTVKILFFALGCVFILAAVRPGAATVAAPLDGPAKHARSGAASVRAGAAKDARPGAVIIEDDAGQRLFFSASPRRVASLVPTATEIMAALGAAKSLAGRTRHDQHLADVAPKPVIGGAFSPHFDRIAALAPDLLIVAPRDYEKALRESKALGGCPVLVWDDGANLAGAEEKILWLGTIFNRQAQAEKLISENRELMETIRRKVDKIPASERQRVMRVMLSEGVLLSPGRDSFQTELIKAAGGIPPQLDAGAFTPVDREVWEAFDPQFVYACGPDAKAVEEFLQQPGWNKAEAVKNGRIQRFPCALTCRAGVNTGYFAAWLAGSVYADSFALPEALDKPDARLGERPLKLDLPYVAGARIVESRILDFTHRTLLIDFARPQRIVSTVSGQRDGILSVGNSYSPTPAWGAYHKLGFNASRDYLFTVLGLDERQCDILSTGADMNNLAVKTVSYDDLSVTALATAGVEGNALRAGKDVGAYYEKPGTINIIVMTNHRLSDRAAARALITITEAKTCALWDMDVRSVQSPLRNPATGTGTDDIIVVQGEGGVLDYSGGHGKLGQLISEAVYAAVQEALLKQNGKIPVRDVFERLEERGLPFDRLETGPDYPRGLEPADFRYALEGLLLEPGYAGFIEAAFALADARSMGQFTADAAFTPAALAVATEIAGRQVEKIEKVLDCEQAPEPLCGALNTLATGLVWKH